ncbi:hypothetical protein ALI22I_28810 [Saccharothrix sp. ALI-22-I]|uniref:hypothetical protein n=1 Tax=Saccharothrix sp. ALI-22-I TaxID=1933778 RepID=UPI00097BC75A|nr:hypothetical protein [Saccharothrix sp. ALI-22-I]ONI84556.1 hypothetical protein ALI22I_28810 [Saccharothrix sp. ALI-22-I]
MTDLDLPPNSPLPDGVRAAALTRLRAGLDAPPPRHLPLKVAAVAVAVATATTVAVQFTDRGDDTASTTPSPTEIPELRHHDAGLFYNVREGSAPDGAAQRCQARSTDLPAPERWTAIATASRHRVDLMAFETTAGIVFCETTPMSVTVSSPQADPGTLAVAFTTATGSMAGFNGADPRPFALAARTDEPGERAIVARSGRLFLMPNGFVSDGVVAQPEVASSAELVQNFELTTPPLTGTVVDRPVTPEDRDGAEGRRLGECLADQPQPIPDPSAWRAGQASDLTPTESVQLGHYGDLLLVCREDRTVAVYDFSRADAPQRPGMLLLGKTVRGVRVYYDFVQVTQDGTTFTSSDTEALIAEVTDARVATVTLVSTGNPDITAAPAAGSVVLPGLKANDLGARQARIVVRDASGTVLEEVPQEF